MTKSLDSGIPQCKGLPHVANFEPPLTSAIQCKIFPLDPCLVMLKPSRMFSAAISAGPACGGGGVKTR